MLEFAFEIPKLILFVCFKVTVDAPNPGGWQVQAEDGRSVQIEAPNLIIQQPPEAEMVEMQEIEEEHVAEEYDPMSFFAGPPADLNQQHEHDPNVGAVDSSIIGKCDFFVPWPPCEHA